MSLEWLEHEPVFRTRGKYDALRAELRTRPGDWAKSPVQTYNIVPPNAETGVWKGYQGRMHEGVFILCYLRS